MAPAPGKAAGGGFFGEVEVRSVRPAFTRTPGLSSSCANKAQTRWSAGCGSSESRPKEGFLEEMTSECDLKDWIIGAADGAGTCQTRAPSPEVPVFPTGPPLGGGVNFLQPLNPELKQLCRRGPYTLQQPS